MIDRYYYDSGRIGVGLDGEKFLTTAEAVDKINKLTQQFADLEAEASLALDRLNSAHFSSIYADAVNWTEQARQILTDALGQENDV